MVTIKQIAEKVGVSTTTVSNVIHGKYQWVSKETVRRVQAAIEEMNYIPNMSGRILAKNSSKIIGVVLNYAKRENKYVMQDPFYGELIGAVEDEIRRSGYFTMLYVAPSPEEVLDTAHTWNFDGILICRFHEQDGEELIKKCEKPVVFIDGYLPHTKLDYANVGLDDFGGGYTMTSHLIKKGHRNIAFLADDRVDDPQAEMGVNKMRWRGYLAALEEAGLSPNARFVHLDPDRSRRQVELEHFYQQIGGYTALFCISDFYALELLIFLQNKGVRVPEEISIAGFDDNQYADMIRPGITTIRQDISYKGKRAVQLILSLIEGRDVQEKRVVLPVELVTRDSVKQLQL